MGFHHGTGGHFVFPLYAHHICNTRASAVEMSQLEVTIKQGRPTTRFMEEETELRRGKGGERHAWLNLTVAAVPFIWSLLLTAISDKVLYLHV